MKENNLEELLSLSENHLIPHAVIVECNNIEDTMKIIKEITLRALCTSESQRPCRKCSGCLKVLSDSHTDVKVIAPEKGSSSIKVEKIRKIREDAYIKANEGGYKFYIIQNGDRMTAQSQNAFIKILEEPPKNVVFIILCNSASSLLATVRSRCQIYRVADFKNDVFEYEELSSEFADAILAEDKYEMVLMTSKIPNDRIVFKKFVEHVLHNLLVKYYEKSHNISGSKFINMLDKLNYVASLIPKNINFNLLLCYLCAEM